MIELRHIGTDELQKIQNVAHVTWPMTFGQVMSKAQISYMLELNYSEASLKMQMLEHHHNFIIAERDTECLGFASYILNFNSEPQLMIFKLYIIPSAQRLGIGSELLAFLAQTARERKYHKLRLKVFFLNSNAIRFYEKSGFINVGTEFTDIGHHYIIQDLIMEKQL